MKLFDNKVQETKYKVLREVAYQTWKGNDAFTEFNEIANNVIPKGEPPQTCCIYKDRAVVAERIRLALGGSKNNDRYSLRRMSGGRLCGDGPLQRMSCSQLRGFLQEERHSYRRTSACTYR